jgi:hypothetical protein
MMKVGFFKKIFLFFVYRSKLLKLETDLKLNYNLRIDNVLRFYTVLNIPESVLEEPYNFRRSDIDTISRSFISEYTSNLSQYLNMRGFTELFVVYDIEKVDKYSYLLVFGFSLFNTKRTARYLVFIGAPLILLSIIILMTYIIFG